MTPPLCEQCWTPVNPGQRAASNVVWLHGPEGLESLARWFHLECLAQWLAGQLPQAWHGELWQRLAAVGVSRP